MEIKPTHMTQALKDELIAAARIAFPELKTVDLQLTLEAPKKTSLGDLATNLALVVSAQLQQPSEVVAQAICEVLIQQDSKGFFSVVEVANPGFINFTMSQKFWIQFLETVQSAGINHGKINLGHGEKINLEFVSANPTGPMHIGHARGAVYGDTIARLLEWSGFEVTREYYINDAGKQIYLLAKSVYCRYLELIGEVQLGTIVYPGEYVIDIAKSLLALHGKSLLQIDEAERTELISSFAIEEMLIAIKEDLASLEVKHDVFFSEKHDLLKTGRVDEVIALLQKRELTYLGIPAKPQGDDAEWEPAEQLLFKAKDFGDDSDRTLRKPDGSYSYFAPDVAYHYDKCCIRGFKNMILLLGADHIGYVKRLSAAVKAISSGEANLKILIMQLVTLMQNGTPLKMSKRSGNFITISEALAILDKDIIRFQMLMRKNNSPLEIDIDKAREQSKDNAIFYIQYAHTRAASLIRRAYQLEIVSEAQISINEIDGKIQYHLAQLELDYSLLSTEMDLTLIKGIFGFTKTIEQATIYYEPHRLAYYLYELASSLHNAWTKGHEDASLRFIIADNIALSQSRIALCFYIARTIGTGLGLLGIKPMLSM